MMEIPNSVMKNFEKYCSDNNITGKGKEKRLEELKKNLFKYQYEPGESIGVVAAQSISEPATQMCVSGNEKVIIGYKDKINVVKIGELIDRALLEKRETVDGYEFFDVDPDIDLTVPSLDKNGNSVWRNVTALCRHASPPYLIEVKTESGRQIKATDFHSFVTRKDNAVVPIAGKDLKTGLQIPVIASLPGIFSACLETVAINAESETVTKTRIRRDISDIKNSLDSVSWEKIIEINRVVPDSRYVYDMTVDDTHTFSTLDGIITHNTMRSYTLASQSDRLSKVTQGLPRLIEIFDARKTFEKNMQIYLDKDHNDKEKAKEIAEQIKEKKLRDIIESDSIDLVNMRIEFKLETKEFKGKVIELLEKKRNTAIKYKGMYFYVKPENDDIKNLRKVKNKILDMRVSGIKGIENVVVVKEEDDWMIQTTGTNLKKVMEVEGVDITRTRSNDLYQTHEVLGIEAARSAILRESKETLDEQGLEIDVRHLMLLADTMTFTGEIQAIGRYGVAGHKRSVLARASFEETKKHLINASFYGEKDDLHGVIENVVIGQMAPVGTGVVDLTVDMKKMHKKK